MECIPIDKNNFTQRAWSNMNRIVNDKMFPDKDAQLIYKALLENFKPYSFGDYLRRYIHTKSGMPFSVDDVPLQEYQQTIKAAFQENLTPAAFTDPTKRLSALSKNWLTQKTVNRNVVFLLGFGLRMSVDDVNRFLTKALREQEINPKDPFEVICEYCYRKRYLYPKFEDLWQRYLSLIAKPSIDSTSNIDHDLTVSIHRRIETINDEGPLITYLAELQTSKTRNSAKRCFETLYEEAKALAAEYLNSMEASDHVVHIQEYMQKLLRNPNLSDSEKSKRLTEFRAKQKIYSKDDITETDLERIICAAIPKDRHGNLVPGKASELNEQFAGKRFSRQRIAKILSGPAEVTRSDLITLNFFIFSQKTEKYDNAQSRYEAFFTDTNALLSSCSMDKLYVQNPYECFVLMCILSSDPLGTYADVMGFSYGEPDNIRLNPPKA